METAFKGLTQQPIITRIDDYEYQQHWYHKVWALILQVVRGQRN